MSYFFLYIDPSSGSYLIQMLIAGILGSLFFFKNAWLKVKSFFTGKKEETKEDLDNEL
jgi:hypothetical protein